MNRVVIEQAEEHEMDWVNSKYQEIDFVKSNFENEYIVIAKFNGKAAGLGRLVKLDDRNIELGGIYVFPDFRGLGVAEHIVSNLCERSPFDQSIIWCLPFENLLSFYKKFGFKEYTSGKVPEEITKKMEWCNTGNKYEKEVFLLCKNG